MTNIKELMQDDKNALSYLHYGFCLDFQKPITIIKQEGKLTVNHIKTCLMKEIDDFSTKAYRIVLLVHPYDYKNKIDSLHAVFFSGDKFNVDVPCGNKYDIDMFYSKGEFENIRKNKTAYYFIIAQQREYLSELNTSRPDTTERFKHFSGPYELCCDGKGNTYYGHIRIKELHKNVDPFEWDVRFRRLQSLSDIIDKSGYLTIEFRNRLKARVCAYKYKKRKAEFLATNYSSVVKALEWLFEKLKTEIANTVINITTYSQARLAEKAMDKFAWGFSYFTTYREHIYQKAFDSRETAEHSEKNIHNYIEAAFEAIREIGK